MIFIIRSVGYGDIVPKGSEGGERMGGVRVAATAIVVGTPGLPHRGWLLG